MLRNLMENKDSAGAEGRAMAQLLTHMNNGMHAMAQPLTVLRSSVAASILPGVTAKDHQRYLEISVEQVERACALFMCLQQLLIAGQNEAECAPMDLSELLVLVIEVQKEVRRTSAVEIEIIAPDCIRPMYGDTERMLLALTTVIKVAASISLPGEIIELQIVFRENAVALIIQNKSAGGRQLNSSARLNLALSEINIRSQNGEFALAEDPFCATLTVPLPEIEPLKNGEVSYGASANRFH